MGLVYGLDEAGRGAFAGPLVAACVVLKNENIFLRDSKKLSFLQREKAFVEISNNALLIDVEVINVHDINNFGLGRANIQIFENLITRNRGTKYIVDGNLKFQNKKITSMIDADAKIPGVMAAGIVAKVTRDRIMQKLHKEFPSFDWFNNKGYGTKFHIEALRQFGLTPHHRIQFVNTALGD